MFYACLLVCKYIQSSTSSTFIALYDPGYQLTKTVPFLIKKIAISETWSWWQSFILCCCKEQGWQHFLWCDHLKCNYSLGQENGGADQTVASPTLCCSIIQPIFKGQGYIRMGWWTKLSNIFEGFLALKFNYLFAAHKEFFWMSASLKQLIVLE